MATVFTLLLFALFSVPAVSDTANKCIYLFRHNLSNSKNGPHFFSETPAIILEKEKISLWFAELSQVIEFETEDYYDHSEGVKKQVQQSLFKVFNDPILLENSEKLFKLIENLDTSNYSGQRNYKQEAKTELQIVLELARADIAKLKTYLLDQLILEAHVGSSGKEVTSLTNMAGYFLRTLPSDLKIKLVQFLAQHYSNEFKRVVPKMIYAILDPKSMYENYKARGKSDKDFYIDWINMLNTSVFKKTPHLGGYRAEAIIELAFAMQGYLKKRDDLQALNFFGSVPNGFARKKSDLDIFNHPEINSYPELHEALELSHGNSRTVDPFARLRYQINDPLMSSFLNPILKRFGLSWHLEDVGERAHDDFGGQSHVFSFHIKAGKIILRFYVDFMDIDKNLHRSEKLTYIELDITR